MSRLPLFLLFSLALCRSGEPAVAAEGRKMKVLTSFLPVYCLASNVAGDLAEVENLLPARVEPHDYQFSRKDLQKLAAADVIFVNGLGLEQWLQKAFESGRRENRSRIVTVFAGFEPDLMDARSTLDSDAGGLAAKGARLAAVVGGPPNPHIWLDPHLACLALTNILKALQQADPTHAAGYASNTARYAARLEALDARLQEALAPIRGASIVTFHDAFPYFARRYGLNVTGVIEPIPEVEPSLKYLSALYRSIRETHARAIFTEPMAVSRLAERMGSDLRVPVAALDTLETGPLDAGAYEEGMRSNGRVLLKYLHPDAPRAFL